MAQGREWHAISGMSPGTCTLASLPAPILCQLIAAGLQTQESLLLICWEQAELLIDDAE
jgi:hypothetical protein